MTATIPDGLLDTLLGLADEPAYEVIRAARARSWALPQLVLSVLESRGFELGSGSRDELGRARLRARRYQDICDQVLVASGARVLKGPSLARSYPDELVRPAGDLDLVVRDERRLWIAVQAVMRRHLVANIDVSLFGHPHRHLVVSLSWPAEDAALDFDYCVEISTAAYPGDSGPVGVRATPPADPRIANLLALAEERFQRPFGAKDILDVVVLAESVPAHAVADLAGEYLLAPELLELLELCAEHVRLGDLDAIIPALRTRAEHERERRAVWSQRPDVPAHGFLLRRLPWRDRLSELVERTEGTLLRTPVADYLLVSGATVSQAAAEWAAEQLSVLDDVGSRP